MKVRAEFYSRVREIVGAFSAEFQLRKGATANDLLKAAMREFPRLRDLENSLLLGVDLEFVDKNQALKEGDVVAIMPPVQGG